MTNVDYSDEIWKPILEFRLGYEISSFGRVKRDGVILKEVRSVCGNKYNEGYYSCSYTHNYKVNRQFIHRLVAKYFIDNPFHLNQVNHKNGKTLDNRVSNLEWVTAKQNIHHSYRLGLVKSRPGYGSATMTSKIYTTILTLAEHGHTNLEIGRLLKMDAASVSRVINGHILPINENISI